ncbi:hypothetical protein BB560_003692, partial [Smittium megazygosporum]
LDKLVLNPKYHDVLAILKGVRNGFIYGARIRFPHALVMTFLFRSGSLSSKFRAIYKATREHALKLAAFVAIYKTLLLLQRRLFKPKDEALSIFIAGFIGGGIVFRKENSINQQVLAFSIPLFSSLLLIN